MMYWVIIGLMILIALTFFRFEHGARKMKIIILVILGLLVYLSIVTVFSSKNVDVNSPRGIVSSVYFYFGWIGNTLSNLWDIGADTVHTVGNAIKVNNTEQKNN
ncbi:MAG: hypothetical protein Q8N88_02880 [Nanoarchaeota archaeon]|nr:hypothetical protein [Nanoarchaeota archaeon]